MNSQYVLAGKLIAAGVLLFTMFGLGMTVQGWRMKSAQADAMSQAAERYHALELSVTKQNGGIDLLNYKLTVADESRIKAEQYSLTVRTQLNIQTKRVNELLAASCSDMVNQLKGASQ
jgi:hypothetical protein